MLRRTALKSVVAAVAAAGVAGCTGDGGGEPGTPTDSKGGASVEYLVRNDDDQTHPLEVVIENADGTVVHSRRDDDFEPGEQLGATSEHDPENGPHPITVGLESLSTTIERKSGECPQFDLLVAVTRDGQLEVEREACIK